MLDHMTGGRANAGFARGYQRRWVDIMAQQTHGITARSPISTTKSTPPIASRLRGVLRDHQKGLDRRDAVVQGSYWRIPPGDTPWTIEATRHGDAA